MASKIAGGFGGRKPPLSVGGMSVQDNQGDSPLTDVYTNAVNSNNSIYNGLMEKYGDLYNRMSSGNNSFSQYNYNPGKYQPLESNIKSAYSPATYTPASYVQGNNLSNQYNYTPSNYTGGSYTPGSPYQPSKEYTNAQGQLQEQAKTGGFSEGDINSIRARGIDPIRSVYANASREVNRKASLSGGQATNFNALTAKMAREMSSQIADQTQRVNADIADRVQAGKTSALAHLSDLTAQESQNRNLFAERENQRLNQYNQGEAANRTAFGERENTRFNDYKSQIAAQNTAEQQRQNEFNAREAARRTAFGETENARLTDYRNQQDLYRQRENQNVNEFNERENARVNDVNARNTDLANKMGFQNSDELQKILSGMQSLYGTTPALSNMFGNQVLSAEQINQRNPAVSGKRPAKLAPNMIASMTRGMFPGA